MCRTAIIMIALATLTAAGASGTEVSAKTHRRTPARSGVHANQRRAIAHTASHAAPARKTTTSRRKQTPEEAGHAAGLAILRARGGQPEARRYVASGARRPRPALRSATARSSRRHLRTYAAPHIREAAFVSLRRTSSAMETDREETTASPTAGRLRVADVSSDEREGASAPAEAPDAGESAVPSSPSAASPVQREVEPEPDSDAQVPNNAEGMQGGANPAADSAEDETPASSRKEAEQASLYIPRAAMPAPLRGSLESLERQNQRLEAEGLERIEDESDLEARIADGVLVPVPESGSLTVNAELPLNHRYCRPWTARFLADLARAHEAAFHKPIEVSSAVRTVEYQMRLMVTNGNAAPAEGDIVSPHLTGATVDIAKKGMSHGELAWMRQRLLTLEGADKIDVEEEFRQACFHVTVYKSYTPLGTLRPPTKATSPANRPKPQPEPSEASSESAAGGM